MYKGYITIKLNKNEVAKYYQEGKFEEVPSMLDNQYLILQDETGRPLDYFKELNDELIKIKYPEINSNFGGTIKPKNQEQYIAMDMLKDNTSKVKMIRGVYGSGKDYLMFNQALQCLEEGKFDKIIFIRPNVTLKNVPEIGYLPGDIEDKLNWIYAPLYDKVGGRDGLDRLISQNKLEMVPLLFVRGMSFINSIVYVTEAQNIDTEIAKVLLGRIGEGSELWLNGDNHQTDDRIFDRDNGLTKIIDKLKGNKLFSYVYLPKTERGEVAALADLLDE